MINAILKNKSMPVRITVKSIIAVFLAAMAAVLPQIAHFFGGSAAGAV